MEKKERPTINLDDLEIQMDPNQLDAVIFADGTTNRIDLNEQIRKEREAYRGEQKNTTLNDSTGQIRTDAASGGLVRSAINIPSDTQVVPSDAAKVEVFSDTTKSFRFASLAKPINLIPMN